MKRVLSLCFALTILSPALAQKEVPEFGRVDPAELRMKSCSFEPSANAMKLFDVQEIEFEVNNYNTKLRTEHRVRLKVFNDKGYKHASIRIPYYSKKRLTKIKELKGVIYNLDASGNVVIQKLEKKDFFKEKGEDNIGVINFTFPNLKPGSVVEFSYTKIEKDIIQIDPWVVQSDIPTAYASTVIKMPAFSRIKEKILGADTIEQRVEPAKHLDGTTRKIYFRENVVSFQPEPFMSSRKDNLLKVIFFLIPESDFFFDIMTNPDNVWKFAGSSLLTSSHFGGQIRTPIPGTEKLVDSAKLMKSITDRIRFIYEAIKKRLPDKAEQTMYPGDIIEAWNNRTGNTAEINLILLNLLKRAGVEAYPLLVSTRENGMVDMKFPSMGQLNGVDVLAFDSTTVFVMDASLKFQSSLNPPFNILNRNAFLLNEDKMQWINVDDKRALLKQNVTLNGTVNDDGTMEGKAYCLYYDYAKSYMLDTTLEDDDDDKFYDKKPEGLTIVSNKEENADDDSKPLAQTLEFNYTPQQTGDFYFINPQLISMKKDNPFIKEKRNTDIDLGCNQKLTLAFHITIPPTLTIESIPKNIIVRAPDSSFFFKRIVQNDSSSIFLSQTFDINQSIFYREDYPGLREFFERVYALMGDEIVLKRKKK